MTLAEFLRLAVIRLGLVEYKRSDFRPADEERVATPTEPSVIEAADHYFIRGGETGYVVLHKADWIVSRRFKVYPGFEKAGGA